MAKPEKRLYRVATTGKPGEEGKFKYYDSLEEVQAAHPDLTGVKVKKFNLRDDDGQDVDPDSEEEDDAGAPV